jgi:aminopeptidase N
MSELQAQTIYLKDYQAPEYLVDSIDLNFILG